MLKIGAGLPDTIVALAFGGGGTGVCEDAGGHQLAGGAIGIGGDGLSASVTLFAIFSLLSISLISNRFARVLGETDLTAGRLGDEGRAGINFTAGLLGDLALPLSGNIAFVAPTGPGVLGRSLLMGMRSPFPGVLGGTGRVGFGLLLGGN